MQIRDLPDRKPPLTEGLIKFLEETYPDSLPRKQVSDFELGFLIGQRGVVDYLKQLYESEHIY